MSKTAYIKLDGEYFLHVCNYDLGPARVTHAETRGWYTKSGFRPQLTDVNDNPVNGVMGDGVAGGTEVGPYAQYVTPAGVTIAAPDEMLPSQALRGLTHDMTYLTFYGAAGAGVVATRTINTLEVGAGHPFVNGQLVTVTTTDALPGGLTADTLYFVVGRTSTVISLALTAGGAAITLSSDGTGVHKVVPFVVAGEFPCSKNPKWSNAAPVQV